MNDVPMMTRDGAAAFHRRTDASSPITTAVTLRRSHSASTAFMYSSGDADGCSGSAQSCLDQPFGASGRLRVGRDEPRRPGAHRRAAGQPAERVHVNVDDRWAPPDVVLGRSWSGARRQADQGQRGREARSASWRRGDGRRGRVGHERSCSSLRVTRDRLCRAAKSAKPTMSDQDWSSTAVRG